MYPMMHDKNFELRLSFAKKVYSIVTFQLLLTVVVVSVFLFVPPVANFFINYVPYYVLNIVTLFALIPVEYYQHQKHPLSYFFLLIFTVSSALLIGLICTFAGGKIVQEAVTLSPAVVISLSFYTFWTSKRNHNFSYLGIFLNGSIFVIILLILIKILYPSGNLLTMIYGWLASITFYGYIVFSADTLIKRYTYAKHISVSISLYSNVAFIFICVLNLFGVAELIKKKEAGKCHSKNEIRYGLY
ncbi:hypothetical protein TSUD_04470 [Trifolium subterraneum]|nr:hypothetical protein TSUD_04470 [Trifolium subterraneum]